MSLIKRVPWHYIVIVVIACVVAPHYISTNSSQKAALNAGAQRGYSGNSLGVQTLSRLNGQNSTGPKSYDTGKVSSNK